MEFCQQRQPVGLIMVWNLLSLTGELLPHLYLQLRVRSEVAEVGLRLTFPSCECVGLLHEPCAQSRAGSSPCAWECRAPVPRELPLPHEEILEVKLTAHEVFCHLGWADGNVPRVGSVKECFAREVLAGLDQLASTCSHLHPGWQCDRGGTANFEARFRAPCS